MSDLKATLSNNTAGAAMARYAYGWATVYAGLEYILFRNPSDAYPNGFETLGGYWVLPGYVNATAYYAEQDPARRLDRAQTQAQGRSRYSPAAIITIGRTTTARALAQTAGFRRRAATARLTPSPP